MLLLLLILAGVVLGSLLVGALPLYLWLMVVPTPRELDWSHSCLPGHAHNPQARDVGSRDGWCTFCHARYVERMPLIHGRPHDARMARDHAETWPLRSDEDERERVRQQYPWEASHPRK